MTTEERIEKVKLMLGDDTIDEDVLVIYLDLAKRKILNHRFPYGTDLTDVEGKYEFDLLELAIVLFNERGVEGQETHNENGVNRKWRSEQQILKSIPRMVGLPK